MASVGPMPGPTGGNPLLDCFWTLSSTSGEERSTATTQLLQHLHSAQRDFEEAAGKHGHGILLPADRPCCNDLAYAVTRLCRGLASSNKGSRQGFALALTQILEDFPNVKSLDIVHNVYKATQYSRRSSREEARDCMLGRIFGALVLQRTGRIPLLAAAEVVPKELDPAFRGIKALLAQKLAAKSGTSSQVEAAEDAVEAADEETDAADGTSSMPLLAFLIEDLLCIASKKTWVADISYEAVSAVIAAAGASIWQSALEPVVTTHLGEDPRAWTPEQLSLALSLDETLMSWYGSDEVSVPVFCTALRSALSKEQLPRYQLSAVDDSEIEQAARVEIAETQKTVTTRESKDDDSFEGASQSDDEEAVKTEQPEAAPLAPALLVSTHAYPQLHSVWGKLLQRFVATAFRPTTASSDRVPDEVQQFAEVWRVYVDELLVPQGPERKATVITLASSLLGTAVAAHPSVLSAILSPNLIKCITHNMTSKKKLLHTPAVAFLESLVTVCHGRSAAASVAVVALLARGHADFDRKTHSQTVAKLLGELDAHALTQHLASAQREFSRPSSAPVFAEIASTVTGMTEASAPPAPEADADEDDDSPTKPSNLSPVDTRRLWALDTISSALKHAALAHIQTEATLRALIAFLSFHAFVDVHIPEAVSEKLFTGKLDSVVASLAGAGSSDAASTKQTSSKKRSRSEAVERPVVAALVQMYRSIGAVSTSDTVTGSQLSVLCADPPLSEYMRKEVAARLASAIRLLAHGLLLSKAGQDETLASNTHLLEWLGTSDRLAGSTLLSCRLLAIPQQVWQLAAQLAETVPADDTGDDSLAITVNPSTADLAAATAGDEDDEDDDEGSSKHEDAASTTSTVMSPAAVRTLALAVCDHITELVDGVSGVDTDAKAKQATWRACLSYAALLHAVNLQVLFEAQGGDAHQSASALHDLILVSPTILADLFTDFVPVGKSAKKAKKAGGRERAGSMSDPLSSLRTVIFQTGAKPAADAVGKDVAVFTDALLYLLASGSALVRECIKQSAKQVFHNVTAEAVCTILDVILEKPAKAEDDGEDDDQHDHDHNEGEDDSDEEAADTKAAPTTDSKKAKTEPKSASKSKPAQPESETDSDSDESEDIEQADDGDVEKYDQMLAAMIVARKQQKSEARNARQRALHFKFRALELLEAALGNMCNTARVGAGTAKSPSFAAPALLDAFIPIVLAIRSLASWARGKGRGATNQAAHEADQLRRKLSNAFLSTSRARFDPTVVTPEQFLALFDEVVAVVVEDPNPAFVEACASVANVVVRNLRDPATNPSQSPQPAVAHVEQLAAGYAEVASAYLTQKHSNLNSSFFKGIVASIPVIAVRLISTFTSLLASDKVVKPFKVVETFSLLATIVKVASASWTANVPCAISSESDGTTVSVSEYLAACLPGLLVASAHVIQRSREAPEDAAAHKVVRLNAKQLKEPLALLAQAAKLRILTQSSELEALKKEVQLLEDDEKFASIQSKCTAFTNALASVPGGGKVLPSSLGKRARPVEAAPTPIKAAATASSAKKARK